jgi:threonine dehydrogenase-like Zn-dependent dehydrogenase
MKFPARYRVLYADDNEDACFMLSTLSSLGVYSGKLQVPYDSFAAGVGDYKIVITLCPGGKELMRRLMEMVKNKRVDLSPLITHRFRLEEIGEAYRIFGERHAGVMKIAITP